MKILENDGLLKAIADLAEYCRSNQWAGYDPYDGLNSRLLRQLGMQRWPLPRLAITQVQKRLPINLRGLLRVPREQNPKGISVFLQALTRLSRLGAAAADEPLRLAERLLQMRSPKQLHCCWGYNFDWQTRTYLVPRFTPNVICTTFAGNALLDAYEQFGRLEWLEAAQSAGRFVLEGLNRTEHGSGFCFSYTPLDHSQVHNANLLGAAFLARLHTFQPSEALRSAAQRATLFSLGRQQPDGSWAYGEAATQSWIDSFHTGYNLMALECIRRCLGMDVCDFAIRRGYAFYLGHFFEPDGKAKYYHNRTYPVDAHSIAQALITLSGLRQYDAASLPLASAVWRWASREMLAPGGWFFYQKWPLWTNRISYMRWSQAWMLLGMACLAEAMDLRVGSRGQKVPQNPSELAALS